MLPVPTVKFTSAVDRDLLCRAKVRAAKADTSVNELFNVELGHRVETFEAAVSTGPRLTITTRRPHRLRTSSPRSRRAGIPQ
jgi:hypothetical protein